MRRLLWGRGQVGAMHSQGSRQQGGVREMRRVWAGTRSETAPPVDLTRWMATTSPCSVPVNRTPLDLPVWIMPRGQVSVSLPESCKRLWESKPPGSEKPIHEGQARLQPCGCEERNGVGPVKADSRVFLPSPWALSHQGLCRPLRYHQETVLFCPRSPPPPTPRQQHPYHPRSG